MPGFEMEIGGTTRAQRWAKAAPLTDQEKKRAALTVCARAARGFDVQIPEHRAAAARLAKPLLEALGLLGKESLHSSPAPKLSKVVHGTRSAVEAHRELGQELCRACLRWTDVESRKAGPTAHADGGDA